MRDHYFIFEKPSFHHEIGELEWNEQRGGSLCYQTLPDTVICTKQGGTSAIPGWDSPSLKHSRVLPLGALA